MIIEWILIGYVSVTGSSPDVGVVGYFREKSACLVALQSLRRDTVLGEANLKDYNEETEHYHFYTITEAGSAGFKCSCVIPVQPDTPEGMSCKERLNGATSNPNFKKEFWLGK